MTTGKVTSCLDAALELTEENRLEIWDSLIAESQSAGRGQLRRNWFSPPGNLYAVLRLPLTPPFASSAASIATGGLLAGALRKMGWPVWLKWPNDLVLLPDGMPRKIGGILLEERKGILLAGVGINITSSPPPPALRKEAAMPAASLAEFADSPPLAESLWRRLVKHVCSIYTEDQTFSVRWRREAEQLLLWRNQRVALTDEQGTLYGVLAGVALSGGICLRVDGKMREFLNGALHLPQDIVGAISL
ncbi:MAG: biotin--[acetyl-CoA-carboxylase] ligase [Desulfovibrio sp.]|nr:biotin--[acetyl-CoA-carboxylase] ligase [Desulfovibrio sp.]